MKALQYQRCKIAKNMFLRNRDLRRVCIGGGVRRCSRLKFSTHAREPSTSAAPLLHQFLLYGTLRGNVNSGSGSNQLWTGSVSPTAAVYCVVTVQFQYRTVSGRSRVHKHEQAQAGRTRQSRYCKSYIFATGAYRGAIAAY
jgi:hypothetical protein